MMRNTTVLTRPLVRTARAASESRTAAGRWPVRRLLAVGILLSLALHLPLVLARLYDLGYDAPIHTFFADHYLRSWWDLWEPRWYTGFSMASYPPLAHQVMALIAFFFGHEAAYPGLLLLTLAILPVTAYAFARAFVGPRPAAYAAVLSGLTPAVGLVAYPFGQLPFLFGTVLALGTLGALGNYLRQGTWSALGLTFLLAGTTAAAHHLTYGLLLPLGGLAVGVHALVQVEGSRRTLVARLALAAAAGLAGCLTVLPFWLWLAGYTQQAPIDHPSRHNLLAEPELQRIFLWPMYGTVPFLLLANLRDLTRPTRLPLIGLVALLAVLGLGGTTSLPWLLYREWASWLTYDRFSGWAALAVLPLLGLTVAGPARRTPPAAGAGPVGRPGAYSGGYGRQRGLGGHYSALHTRPAGPREPGPAGPFSAGRRACPVALPHPWLRGPDGPAGLPVPRLVGGWQLSHGPPPP